jgi:hypothetical protein
MWRCDRGVIVMRDVMPAINRLNPTYPNKKVDWCNMKAGASVLCNSHTKGRSHRYYQLSWLIKSPM